MKNIFGSIAKKFKPEAMECKDLITSLKDVAGIVKLIEAKPGYRKYLTKDGEELIIQSKAVKNDHIYAGSVLSIEKSGNSGICKGFLNDICGPIVKRVRQYEVRMGIYGDLGKEKLGPYIEIFDTSFYKNGGKDYNRSDAIPLPKSAYEKYGIPLNFKIKPILF